jgi:3-dehydroquinate dehydratase
MPEFDFEFHAGPRELVCRFDAADRTPAQVHRAVLEALFASDIGVMEVHLGDGLEREYLRHAATLPPRPGEATALAGS